jgi:hypothetical protein
MPIKMNKRSNLFDDLVVNFDPLASNGLFAIDSTIAPSGAAPAATGDSPGAEESSSGHPFAPPAPPALPGAVETSSGQPFVPPAPVTQSQASAATHAAAADAQPPVADPDFVPPPPPDPPPSSPPKIADPDFVFTTPTAPDTGSPPTVQGSATPPGQGDTDGTGSPSAGDPFGSVQSSFQSVQASSGSSALGESEFATGETVSPEHPFGLPFDGTVVLKPTPEADWHLT